jgi:hypothetical protein
MNGTIFWRSFWTSLLGGTLAVSLFLIVAQMALPQKTVEHQNFCLSNMKRMTLGLIMYSGDFDDRLPPAVRWMDTMGNNSIREIFFHEPEGLRPGEYGFAFCDKASGVLITHIASPQTFELVFDSTMLERNAHSEASTMPRPGRHSGSDKVGFLDGHAKPVSMP